MLPVIYRSLTMFALFTCLSYASGSSCTNLCPGPFKIRKCCDDEFQFPTLRPPRITTADRFKAMDDVWIYLIGFASLIGVCFLILIICSCCRCCILYQWRNGAVYRRFGSDVTSFGSTMKSIVNRGVQKTNTSEPAINQTPSVTVVASHPVQMTCPQSCAPGQMMGHTVYNHLPQSQGTPYSTAMQSPPPCTVAVACEPHHTQPAYNPMYRI